MLNLNETETHIVVEFTNDSGKKYEVGYPKVVGYTKENIEAEIANAKEKFKANASNAACTLSWVPNGESYTSKEAVNLGVIGGHVIHESGYIYDYQINFANSKGWSFTFKDQTDDTYTCSTLRNGNHYINYNSLEPKIVEVC